MEREEKYGKRVKGRENLEYVLGTLLLMCKTYVLFMDRPKLRPDSPSATSRGLRFSRLSLVRHPQTSFLRRR
jgi:hypothetical protein